VNYLIADIQSNILCIRLAAAEGCDLI